MDKKRLFPAVFVVFVNLWGATVILPILPLFVVEQLGGTVLQAVLLDSSYYGAKLLAAPVLGRLSDRYGRRPLLLLCQAGTTAAFLLFLAALPIADRLFAAGWPLAVHPALLLFYLARILDGITGGNSSIAQAYVTDITPEAQRTQALGLLAAALGVGFITGPAIGGVIAGWWGLNAPFVAAAVLAAAGVALSYFLLTESLPPAARMITPPTKQNANAPLWSKTIRQQPNFVSLLFIGFAVTLCFAAISPTFSLYARQVLYADAPSPAPAGRFVGFMFMLMGVVMVIVQGVLLKPISRRWSEKPVLLGGTVLLLTAFAVIPLSATPWGTAVTLIPLAVAYSICEPTLQAAVSKAGSAAAQGLRLGVYASVLSGAYLIGPLWAGFLFSGLGPRALWWGCALFLLPATAVALHLTRRHHTAAAASASASSSFSVIRK
jgi:DHA1 family tetracycline resistance protein-like MFS transporter